MEAGNGQQTSAGLSLKISQGLDESLRKLAQDEGCRGLREIVQYLLEAFLQASTETHPLFSLRAEELSQPPLDAQLRLPNFDEELSHRSETVAKRYGLDHSGFIRTALATTLRVYGLRVPKGEIITITSLADYIYRDWEERVFSRK